MGYGTLGNFNITCFPSERLGDSIFTSAMTKFSYLIFKLDLVDLPLVGGPSHRPMERLGQDWIDLLYLCLGRSISLTFAQITYTSY